MKCIIATNVIGIGVAGWLFTHAENAWGWRAFSTMSAATAAFGAIGMIAAYLQ